MVHLKRHAITFALILLIIGNTSERLVAQWKNVAPNILTNVVHGAIHYKDGVLWAGTLELVFSSDLGKTWTRSNVASGGAGVLNIHFFDRNIGLIGFYSHQLQLTRDGGMTWENILSSDNGSVSAVFDKSSNIIHAIDSRGFIFTSVDGGVTWSNSQIFTRWGTCLAANQNAVYALGALATSQTINDGHISSSTDNGQTWVQKPGIFDGASWSFAIDSCESKLLYVVNEDWGYSTDGFSNIFISTDEGDTWKNNLSLPITALSGSIATSLHTINVTSGITSNSGMYRSTDQGNTWKNLPAPDCNPGSRSIVAIDDNLMFLLDAKGNIWMTENGGGDSLGFIPPLPRGTLSISPHELFIIDTIGCDSRLTRTLSIKRSGCSPPNITNMAIEGADSESYSIISSSNDSLSISLLPVVAGSTSGILVVKKSDGTNDTVKLGGFRKKDTTPLTLTTSNTTTDTIGGSVQIPITLNGLTKPQNIELTLHYDIGLDYRGTFSPSGTALDITGEQWKGRSKLRILGTVSIAPLGFAKFDVFADSATLPKVTFDSLVVLDAASPCEFLLPLAVTSTITPPSDCGIQTLSRFVHLNQMPTLSIYPNPAQNSVTIGSDADLGEATVTLIDMLGNQRMQMMMTLTKDRTATIALDDSPAGIYFVRVRSARGEYRLPFVVQR